MAWLRLFAMVVALGICSAAASAQILQYQRDTGIKVFAYGQQRTLAWCGGFNNPQFAMGDLNNDGLADLVVFEPENSVRTFINTGTPGSPAYVYAPEYELNFPPIYVYLTLADYNCDGIPDLFRQSFSSGFSVYKGYYNTDNELCFTYYKDLYYYDPIYGFNVAAENTSTNTPAIIDVDNDGDLDFLTYSPGLSISFFKNLRVELGLPCDSIQIELADPCWGRFFAGTSFPYFNFGCDDGYPSMASECLFDYNMDGNYDFLGSNSTYTHISLLLNGKTATGPDSMVSEDTDWQSESGGMPVNITRRPAAFNVDIDQDGIKDLLISPILWGDNYKCIWYYKNLSTPGVPNWQFESDTFLVDQTIDLGTAAYPILYDYNKDGKLDLIIGSDGYYQNSNQTMLSRISYYENTSTPGNPSFTLQTTDLLNIDSFNFAGAAPATGDIDNDGIADLIVGHSDGTLSYFKNMAASDTVQPVWQLAELVLTDVDGDTINVGGYAAPFIYDVDQDGRNDLVSGSYDGYLHYYQNIGTTPGVIALKFVSANLGNALADPLVPDDNYSTPFIGKIDTTTTDYLLLGSFSGNIYEYSGIGSGDTSLTYTLLDSQFSFIDSTYNLYNNNDAFAGEYFGLRSTMTVGDIAGDGSLYMIVGNNKGGVELYKEGYVYPSSVPSVNKNETGKVTLYPNPANDQLTLQWSGITTPQVQISIINMEGQQLYTTAFSSATNHAAIPVSMLSDGMYVCVLQSGVSRYYSKFTVVR